MLPHLGANVVTAKLVGWTLQAHTLKGHVCRTLQGTRHGKFSVVRREVDLLLVLLGVLPIGDSRAGEFLGNAA
jgi:hypothetical protein